MQVHLIPNEHGLDELTLIEMQGNLSISGDVRGIKFADLTWTDQKPMLRIRNNLYEGKVVVLDEPFLLVDRSSLQNQNQYQQAEEKRGVIVDGVVRRCILFEGRPRPVIASKGRASLGTSK